MKGVAALGAGRLRRLGEPAAASSSTRADRLDPRPGVPLHRSTSGPASCATSVDRSIAEVAPRPVLIVHGTDDESVPAFDARVVADAHGSAELRMLSGAGHALRHDPRAIAVLLGWLDRQRSTLFV